MKKLNINEDACIGCGACVSVDPEHFDFNDEGLSSVISEENLETEELKSAIECCPTSAISCRCDNEKCECDNCECEDCKCDGSDCKCDSCK